MAATIIINLYQKQVQVDEKFRIDCTKTFTHTGDHNIQTMTIVPESGGETFTITTDKYFDYAYGSDGEKTVTVTATLSGGGGTTTKTTTVTVVTATNENLFSSDYDIIPHEPDILNYLPEYKADYRYVHRLAQDRILTILDERGITDNDGNRIVAADIKDIEECNDWSKFLVLQYIFESLSNAIDDIFHEKALRYREMAKQAGNRAFLRLDYDGDGTLESTEVGTAATGRIYRR